MIDFGDPASQLGQRRMQKTLPLLISAIFILSACAVNAPRTGYVLEPFSTERTIDEYVRKSEIWSDASYVSWSYSFDCGDVEEDCLMEEVMVTASKAQSNVAESSDSITNNQEQGVDEGDIVKRIGNHIVLLRRGRLFSFSLPTRSSTLQAIDYIDVAPANEDIDAWYDEILNFGKTIILIGYSYDIDAVLIRKFEMAGNGEISAGKSYFFTSSDYFDAENYATRLVDGNLIFYMPRDLPNDDNEMIAGEIVNGETANVGSAFSQETIYQPLQQSRDPVLHTIANCPLDREEFTCTATSFIGPWAQLFYISNDSVYLWLNSDSWAFNFFLMSDRYVRRVATWWRESYDDVDDLAVVYRVPIDGGTPGAVEARGWPMNQFSFRETGDSLQVFVRDSAWEDQAQPAVLDIPLRQFSTQITKVEDSNFRELPMLDGQVSANRFIGDYLLYDDTVDKQDGDQVTVMVQNLRTSALPMRFPLDHFAERIEPVGDTAIVIGTDDQAALGISTIGLSNTPVTGQTTWLHRAIQADERSHSFNFRRDSSMDILGLPVIYVPEEERYDWFWPDEASDVHMTYFGLNPDLNLQLLGELVGRGTEEDDCEVSCSDWYGDSRPFYIDDRLYALLGYELIEGYLSGVTLHESARADALTLLPRVEGR